MGGSRLISGSGQRGIDTWRTREALVPPVREAVRRLLDLLLEHTESDVAPVGVSSLAEGPTWPGPARLKAPHLCNWLSYSAVQLTLTQNSASANRPGTSSAAKHRSPAYSVCAACSVTRFQGGGRKGAWHETAPALIFRLIWTVVASLGPFG